MARFDVYASRIGASPLLLCQIQASYHDHLKSRVVIPLLPVKDVRREHKSHLTPRVTVENKDYLMLVADMATVPVSVLGRKVISLEHARDEIVRAIDFLMEGF